MLSSSFYKVHPRNRILLLRINHGGVRYFAETMTSRETWWARHRRPSYQRHERSTMKARESPDAALDASKRRSICPCNSCVFTVVNYGEGKPHQRGPYTTRAPESISSQKRSLDLNTTEPFTALLPRKPKRLSHFFHHYRSCFTTSGSSSSNSINNSSESLLPLTMGPTTSTPPIDLTVVHRHLPASLQCLQHLQRCSLARITRTQAQLETALHALAQLLSQEQQFLQKRENIEVETLTSLEMEEGHADMEFGPPCSFPSPPSSPSSSWSMSLSSFLPCALHCIAMHQDPDGEYFAPLTRAPHQEGEEQHQRKMKDRELLGRRAETVQPAGETSLQFHLCACHWGGNTTASHPHWG